MQSYDNPAGKGDRRDGILAIRQGFPINGSVLKLISGDTSGTGYYWPSSAAGPGKWLEADFGQPRVVDEVTFRQQTNTDHGEWQWSGSIDGVNYTPIGSPQALNQANEVFTELNGNTAAYRYYRMTQVSGSTSNSPYIFAIEFRIDEPSGPSTYYHPLGFGDRRPLIGVTGTAWPVSSVVPPNHCVGRTNLGFLNPPGNSPYFTNGEFSDRTVVFDFAEPVILDGARWWVSATADFGVWRWSGSNDGAEWVFVGPEFLFNPVPVGPSGQAQSIMDSNTLKGNTTAFRYYRVQQQGPGTLSTGPEYDSVNFRVSTAAPQAGGSGPVPSTVWAPPTGVAGAPVVAGGLVPSVAWAAPEGAAEAIQKTTYLTQYASSALIKARTEGLTTQLTNCSVASVTAEALTTQMSNAVTARVYVNTRVTQMALLVLAKGKEPPLVPNPLIRNDGGQSPILDQRLVNMYVQKTDNGPSRDARFGRPGLERATQLGPGPIRATFIHKGFRYTVSGDTVWRDQVYIGEVPLSGDLRWAISDEEIVVVAGRRAYYVTLHNVSRINDPDLTYVRDVKFLAGRFIYFDDDTSGFYRYSKLNDARSIDGLAFASAELNPDPIVGAEVQGELLAIFGTLTTEWHYPTTDPANPFKRSAGRTYDKGCLAIQTVQKADNTLYFVGHDRMVYKSAGAPERVSNHDVENSLRQQTDEQFKDNSSFKVVFGGHTFYVLNIVGFGSWAYDIGYDSWAEWKSWGMDRFRVGVADEDGFMGDAISGSIFTFNGKRYDDVGDPIERVVSTFMPLRSGTLKNFNLALYTVQGVGRIPLGPGADNLALAKNDQDPSVEMRFSDHLGLDYTPWMEAPLGRHQVRGREALAVWTSLGSFNTPGRVFEFRCTDFVEFSPYAVAFNEARL